MSRAGDRRGKNATRLKTAAFRVRPGERVDLRRRPTREKPCYKSEEDYEALLAEHVEKLRTVQNLLYADNRYALLVIFQGMDAAGKDGAIRHILSGINPQGCMVFSFKHPSAHELEHDFLWRTTLCLPERGRIGVFNRSYYEEVLIVRVHPEILAAQGLPQEALHDGDVWDGRYRSILDLEKHLHRNGTRVVKFFLHLSKQEQRKRFLARLDAPEKRWKFQQSDVDERKLWKEYRKAYEAALSATSTKAAPWYVVPADDKKNARLIISQVIVETLAGLELAYPKPSLSRQDLAAIRRTLAR